MIPKNLQAKIRVFALILILAVQAIISVSGEVFFKIMQSSPYSTTPYFSSTPEQSSFLTLKVINNSGINMPDTTFDANYIPNTLFHATLIKNKTSDECKPGAFFPKGASCTITIRIITSAFLGSGKLVPRFCGFSGFLCNREKFDIIVKKSLKESLGHFVFYNQNKKSISNLNLNPKTTGKVILKNTGKIKITIPRLNGLSTKSNGIFISNTDSCFSNTMTVLAPGKSCTIEYKVPDKPEGDYFTLTAIGTDADNSGSAQLLVNINPISSLGGPGWCFDQNKYDPNFPVMREYAKAGVIGGIPFRHSTRIKQVLDAPGDDRDMATTIQNAIDKVANLGGGVVLLHDGNYFIKSNDIRMRSNVILRGESKEKVLLQVLMSYTATGYRANIYNQKVIFFFKGVQHSALEDLSVSYRVYYKGKRVYPLGHDWGLSWRNYTSRLNKYRDDRLYFDRTHSENDYESGWIEKKDMYIAFVLMNNYTQNCWIDNCNFEDAGANMALIDGNTSHITIRDTYMSGSFQRGPGNGYLMISGSYILMVRDTVKQLRHWAIQQGTKYSVIFKCYSESDMNFHQKDKGYNLIEDTKIIIPGNHMWPPFAAGASFHGDPGPENLFYNNDITDYRYNQNKKYLKDKIYTFTEKNLTISPKEPPSGKTLYAVTLSCGNS